MRDATANHLRRGAFALFVGVALSSCSGPEPCLVFACAIAECANPPSDECVDSDDELECTDAVNDCSQCYLDNVADLCNPKPGELDACVKACGGP